ncbi:MAG: hypothetical protein ACXQTE_00985 [Methanosarcinaceae archaeon]
MMRSINSFESITADFIIVCIGIGLILSGIVAFAQNEIFIGAVLTGLGTLLIYYFAKERIAGE